MDLIQIKQQWQTAGFCIFPYFMDASQMNKLWEICDDILQQWFANAPNLKQRADSPNMAYLTEPIYFKHQPNHLIDLLEFIANPKILAILKFISQRDILFHNTQYFFNPTHTSRAGDWHRDTQFLAADPELEKKRMQHSTGVHFRIAFLQDHCLEYVPGSEQRWDTPEEYAIRKGEKGQQSNSDEMPGKIRILLNPGDALLFHAWGIHRGSYDVETPRRTLDIIYQWGNPCNYCPPLATCFQQHNLLEQLNPSAGEFFRYFIQTYENYWLKEII